MVYCGRDCFAKQEIYSANDTKKDILYTSQLFVLARNYINTLCVYSQPIAFNN